MKKMPHVNTIAFGNRRLTILLSNYYIADCTDATVGDALYIISQRNIRRVGFNESKYLP